MLLRRRRRPCWPTSPAHLSNASVTKLGDPSQAPAAGYRAAGEVRLASGCLAWVRARCARWRAAVTGRYQADLAGAGPGPAGGDGPIALRQSDSGCLGSGTYLARSSLGPAPALDRLVHSWDVVAQSDPDLFIVDSVIGVRCDDPHTLDLPPGDLRRRLDDLVRQLGGNVAQSADDGLAREASGRSVSQRCFPSLTSSAAASAASARSARRSSTPLVTDPRPRRECGRRGF